MRKLLKNENASIVPLAVALLVIVIGGLIIGILNLFIAPISNTDNDINKLMTYVWIAIPVVVILVIVFYTMAQGQRAR